MEVMLRRTAALVAAVADQAGSFVLAYSVPGHVQSGRWDRFTISGTARMPSIQITK